MLPRNVHARFLFHKQQIFDNDLISSDDPMGEAEVDLQPMITAAMAFGDPDWLANMQIGKWLRSNDNALTKDSVINIVELMGRRLKIP
ncbi:hypothetical protein ZIOFF_049368 [Zingiber officinale]|uniref:Uncharacterized protein n=1 Tax=Zingiber officinale TaxID=94328 RepID=A0A8J5KYG5_ZINOF|nr:hypothetical protein ZIOFF_049368 [Zingiber officinale]